MSRVNFFIVMIMAIVFSGCTVGMVKHYPMSKESINSIDKKRGATSAHVSEEQAKQYNRQRQSVSNEVSLESKHSLDSLFGGGSTGNLIDTDTNFSDTTFK